MILRLSLTLLIATAWLFVQPIRVQACSCGGTPSPSEELRWAGSVFRGVASSVDDDDLAREIEIKFAVLTVWKGEVSKEISVCTGHGGGDCGYRFHEGVEYIVYAGKETNGVGICGRTTPIGLAGLDLDELGPGTTIDYGGDPPMPYDPADRTPIGERTWLIPVAAALLAITLGIVRLVMKRVGLKQG